MDSTFFLSEMSLSSSDHTYAGLKPSTAQVSSEAIDIIILLAKLFSSRDAVLLKLESKALFVLSPLTDLVSLCTVTVEFPVQHASMQSQAAPTFR